MGTCLPESTSEPSLKRRDKLWLLGPYIPVCVGVLVLRNAWIAMLGFHGVMLAVLWIYRKQWRVATLWSGGSLVWVPAVALSTLIFGIGQVWLAGMYPGYDHHLRQIINNLGMSGWGLAFYAIYTCLVNPVIEEAFWRGLFFERTKRPAISDLAYGAVHIPVLLPFMLAHQALIGAVFLVGVGYLWRSIARCRNGLALPVVWHACGDTAIVLAVAWIIRAG